MIARRALDCLEACQFFIGWFWYACTSSCLGVPEGLIATDAVGASQTLVFVIDDYYDIWLAGTFLVGRIVEGVIAFWTSGILETANFELRILRLNGIWSARAVFCFCNPHWMKALVTDCFWENIRLVNTS